MIASQSQFTQKSLILPSCTSYHALAVASQPLPVGAIPRKSPLCVAAALTRTATRSPSAITCSTVISRSGNAWTVPGAICLRLSFATNSSMLDESCWTNTSSMNRKTTALFSSADNRPPPDTRWVDPKSRPREQATARRATKALGTAKRRLTRLGQCAGMSLEVGSEVPEFSPHLVPHAVLRRRDPDRDPTVAPSYLDVGVFRAIRSSEDVDQKLVSADQFVLGTQWLEDNGAAGLFCEDTHGERRFAFHTWDRRAVACARVPE